VAPVSGEPLDRSRYLERIGVSEPTAPTLPWLLTLHRAHVDVLPYDNLAIMLGRPDPVDATSTLARVAAEVLVGADAPSGRPDHLAQVVTIEGQRWWAGRIRRRGDRRGTPPALHPAGAVHPLAGRPAA
jgi:hypothetical protein